MSFSPYPAYPGVPPPPLDVSKMIDDALAKERERSLAMKKAEDAAYRRGFRDGTNSMKQQQQQQRQPGKRKHKKKKKESSVPTGTSNPAVTTNIATTRTCFTSDDVTTPQ